MIKVIENLGSRLRYNDVENISEYPVNFPREMESVINTHRLLHIDAGFRDFPKHKLRKKRFHYHERTKDKEVIQGLVQ